MKKIIIIAMLLIATVCAKAQQMITVNNWTSTSYDFVIQGLNDNTGPCTGPTSPLRGFFTVAPGIYMGGPVSITDLSWGWTPAPTEFFQVAVKDRSCGSQPGNIVGSRCGGFPATSSFTDCVGNPVSLTWTVDPITGDITVDIN